MSGVYDIPPLFAGARNANEEFSRFDIVHLHQDRHNYTCMLAQKPHTALVEGGTLNTKLSVR